VCVCGCGLDVGWVCGGCESEKKNTVMGSQSVSQSWMAKFVTDQLTNRGPG